MLVIVHWDVAGRDAVDDEDENVDEPDVRAPT